MAVLYVPYPPLPLDPGDLEGIIKTLINDINASLGQAYADLDSAIANVLNAAAPGAPTPPPPPPC